MRRFAFTAAGLLTCAIVALWAPVSAQAAHVLVNVSEPVPALAGQPSQIDAALMSVDTGSPVAGANVTFYVHATFGKVDGFMEIGRAVTNSAGVAEISFVPREGGTHEIRVEYAGAAGAVEQTTSAVAVDGGAPQLFVQKAGIQVPGLDSRLIIGLLCVVWATLLFIGITVVRIARVGRADGLAVTAPVLAGRAK